MWEYLGKMKSRRDFLGILRELIGEFELKSDGSKHRLTGAGGDFGKTHGMNRAHLKFQANIIR